MEQTDVAWKRIPIDTVVRANETGGGHFFERSAKAFFRSRVSTDAWSTEIEVDGRRVTFALFRTSEKNDDRPRLHTVRFIVWDAACHETIDEIGKFQEHATARDANAVISHIRKFWTAKEVAQVAEAHVMWWRKG